VLETKSDEEDSLLQFNELISLKEGKVGQGAKPLAEEIENDESFFHSILSGEILIDDSDNVEQATLSGGISDNAYYDITTAPYKRAVPKQPTAPSTKDILQRQRVQAGFDSLKSDKSSFVDVTRPKFMSRQKSFASKSGGKIKPAEMISKPPDDSVQMPGTTSDEITLDIIAPAGSLGVVVNNVDGQTFVCDIKEKSPIAGRLSVGDQIVAIDDESVLESSAEDISSLLLSKSANKARKITLFREQGDATESDQGFRAIRFDEVKRWLLSYLPSLQKEDLTRYINCLIEDGFDSRDMMVELTRDDIQFMKKAHQRVLSKYINGSEEYGYSAVSLGAATRMGIEQIVHESRAKNSAARKIQDERIQKVEEIFLSRKNQKLKDMSAEKAEAERRVAEAQTHIEEVTRIIAEEKARVRDIVKKEMKLREKFKTELKTKLRKVEITKLDKEIQELDAMRRLKESQREAFCKDLDFSWDD